MFLTLVLFFCINVGRVASIDPRAMSGRMRRGCSETGEVVRPGRILTSGRLKALREVMRTSAVLGDIPIDAMIVTTHDDHQSEFVADHDKRLQYISGFSGSYGTAIVTANRSALWTDGRYFLQADSQLDCNWLLFHTEYRTIPTEADWLIGEFASTSDGAVVRVAADPKLIANGTWSDLEQRLAGTNLRLVEVAENPVDTVWEGRPPRRDSDAFVWEFQYAGKKWTDKVDETRREFLKLGADAMIVTALDEIAWLLNIRGRDIPHNPFVRSYVILTVDSVTLYVNPVQLKEDRVWKHLNSGIGIGPYSTVVKNYSDIWSDIPTEAQKWTFLLPSKCVFSPGASHAIYSLVPKARQVPAPSPIIYLKARKNPVEIRGMENAHVRDAAAMCKFFAYFEKRFTHHSWTEMDVVKILNEHRFEQKKSLGNSFHTIAAFGRNGALPNYEPTSATNVRIYDNSTLVLDSGAQYYDGTTDVTRTLHLGTPTPKQREAYTRVLMGMIQFTMMVFPVNMRFSAVDVMVRSPLWQIGLDYSHESGHGIGSFSVYRESPIKIQYEQEFDVLFEPGYFFSSEPAYYEEGEFGIRLENIFEVVVVPFTIYPGKGPFYKFKVVTLVPFEPKLIDLSLLNSRHKRWLNEYNKLIRLNVGSELERQKSVDGYRWMLSKTEPIPEHGGRGVANAPLGLPATLAVAILTNKMRLR